MSRRMRTLIRSVALSSGVCALGVAGLSFYQPRWLLGAAERAFPGILFKVHTDRPVVALTFDDGPDPAVTPQVLDILRRERVLATWLLVGSAAAEHPELVRAILSDGHQIANHMWDRTPAWTLSRRKFVASVTATAGIGASDGMRSLLRPASGWVRPTAASWARRNGYRIVLGSVYTNDPLKPPSRYIAWAVPRMAGRGDIIVLHVGAGRERTAKALPEIIARLRAKGLEPVRLSDLLATESYFPTQNELKTRSSTSSTSTEPINSSRE